MEYSKMNLHALVWPLHAIQLGFGATDDKDYNQGTLPTDIGQSPVYVTLQTLSLKRPVLWIATEAS